MSDLEIKDWLSDIVLSVGNVLDIYIKKLIPVIFGILQINWMTPLKHTV